MVLPPESMHVVCIGYMAHLVQGFSWMRKLWSGARTEEDSDHGVHYVFGETYRNQEQVEAKLIKLGRFIAVTTWSQKANNCFFYLYHWTGSQKQKQNQNREKAGTQMWCVLLTLLYFMVCPETVIILHQWWVKKLSEYVKLFDLTLGLEAFWQSQN